VRVIKFYSDLSSVGDMLELFFQVVTKMTGTGSCMIEGTLPLCPGASAVCRRRRDAGGPMCILSCCLVLAFWHPWGRSTGEAYSPQPPMRRGSSPGSISRAVRLAAAGRHPTRTCLRLRGGSRTLKTAQDAPSRRVGRQEAEARGEREWEGGEDDSQALRDALAAELAKIAADRTDADESVPSDAVSWGSDASEWQDSDLAANEQASRAEVSGQASSSSLDDRRARSAAPVIALTGRKRERGGSARADEQLESESKRVSERTQSANSGSRSRLHPGREGQEGKVSRPEAEAVGNAPRILELPHGRREHLVTRHEATAGKLVTVSSSALDPDVCDLASYFKRYHGLVGLLLRPSNAHALAWWARFPGYAEDVFSTGGPEVCV
jgi:hypothetical protein